jgi:hypothetical protein
MELQNTLKAQETIQRLLSTLITCTHDSNDLLELKAILLGLTQQCHEKYQTTLRIYAAVCVECDTEFAILDTPRDYNHCTTCLECIGSSIAASALRAQEQEVEIAVANLQAETVPESPMVPCAIWIKQNAWFYRGKWVALNPKAVLLENMLIGSNMSRAALHKNLAAHDMLKDALFIKIPD